MRLFVAVWPPSAAVSELDRAVAAARAAVPALRWTQPAQWHLTLAFLGEVADPVRPQLDARLARAATRHPPLRLRLSGAGRFGRQVLYVRVEGDVVALCRLATSVTAAARRCGVPVDERPHRPHLTLARSRGAADLRPAVDVLAGLTGSTWTASQIQLMASRPAGRSGQPPSYETMAAWPLAATRSPVPGGCSS